MMQKSYTTLPIEEIRPYENNPRINDDAVEAVRKSMEQCGYIAPIVVDEYHVVLAGHTRLKALKQMGATHADVLVVSGLSETRKQKYRLLDNKTNELADWDFEALADELDGLDFEDLELDWYVGNDLDYIDELMNGGITSGESGDDAHFSVTFTIDNIYRSRYDDYIDAHGKESLQALILDTIERG